MVKKSTKNIEIERGTRMEDFHLKNVTHAVIGVDLAVTAVDMHLLCGSPCNITHEEAATLTSVNGNRILVDRKATVEYVYWAAIAEHACETDEKSFCGKDLPSKQSPTRLATAEEILLMEMPEADKLKYLPLRIKAYKARQKLEKGNDRQPEQRPDTVAEITVFFRRALATGKLPNLKPQAVEKEPEPDRFDLVIEFLEEQLNQAKIRKIVAAS